jgi:hypothetical protein
MHTISVEFQPAMKVNIHNQCSYFKLTDQGYFSSGTYWNKDPDEEVNAGNMMNVDLMLYLSTFGGVLTYKLESEYVKPDNRRE